MSDTVARVSPVSAERPTDVGRFPWVILVVCFVILLPTLAFPFGQDQSTFLRGGREILGGGTLYVDFIDVKPPLIYVLYGIADILTGGSVVLMRVLDILLQVFAIAMLVVVMRSITAHRLWWWTSAVLYSVLYSTLGYSQTAQAESFCAIPIVASIWCATKTSGRRRWVILGISIGIAFALKYTLGIIGPAVMMIWLLRDGRTASWRAITYSSLLAASIIVLTYIPFLLMDGFVEGMQTTMQYLRVYASYPNVSIPFATDALKQLGTYFGDNLSITVTSLVLIGAGLLLSPRHSQRELSFLTASIAVFVVLLATVILERKFSPYHFSRLYLPIMILAGAGATYLFSFRIKITSMSREMRWSLVALSLCLLALSPLPRYVNVVQLALRSIGNPHVYDAYLTRPEIPGFSYTSLRALKTDLDVRLVPTDTVIIMSMMATSIVSHLPTQHTSSFADSHLYFGVGADPAWRERAIKDVLASDWIVVDTIDACEGVNLHLRTSWQSLQRDSLIMPVVRSHFTVADTVDCFILFKRIAS